MVCPVNAIESFAKPDGSVGINIIEKKCIGCGRCKDVCDHITWDPSKIGVSVLIGGKSSNTGVGPTLARVLVPWIPVHPPKYPRTSRGGPEDHRRRGEPCRGPGRRVADYVNRVGMKTVFDGAQGARRFVEPAGRAQHRFRGPRVPPAVRRWMPS